MGGLRLSYFYYVPISESLYKMNVLGYSYNITPALLEWLANIYPNKLPLEQVSSEELAFLRGQQSVIQKLLETYNEEYEEI